MVSFSYSKKKFPSVTLLILDFFFFNQFVHPQVLGLWRRELEKTDIPVLEEPGNVRWEKVIGKEMRNREDNEAGERYFIFYSLQVL